MKWIQTLARPLLVSFNIFMSPRLYPDSSFSHSRVSTSNTRKAHVILDQHLMSLDPNMHLKILREVGAYSPFLVDEKPVGFVKLPSIYELNERLFSDIDENMRSMRVQGRGSFHRMRYESMETSLPYDRYCIVEAELAKITKSYINDEKRTWFLLMDAVFMYKDGVPRYLTRDENLKVLYISPSVDIGYTQMVVWTDYSSSSI